MFRGEVGTFVGRQGLLYVKEAIARSVIGKNQPPVSQMSINFIHKKLIRLFLDFNKKCAILSGEL